MKIRIFYLLLLTITVVYLSGCFKQNKSAAPAPVPSGSFSGVFRFAHQTSMGQDTGSANLNLTMSTSAGYAITGDTSTVHAGSHGGYIVYSSTGQILFEDATFPKSGTPSKIHLAGLYNYVYDGNNLQLSLSSPQDTVVFYYSFKKN